MTRATKTEKMQMIRLAAVIENLHQRASDPSTPEADGIEAARTLGQTMLKNLELITTGLRTAGK